MTKRTDRLKLTGSIVRRKLDTIRDANDTIHEEADAMRQLQNANAVTPTEVYRMVASIEGALIEQLRALDALAQILKERQ